MALRIKKGHMWRGQIEDKPGTFANALAPFAKSKYNLQVVTGWSPDKNKQTGSIEVYPVADEQSKQCAKEAGLHEVTDIVCLIVEGEDRPGLAYDMAKIMSDLGINLRFAVCQGVKPNFLACFGFHNDADAEKALKALAQF